jgi:ATP-dependent helicase/nuclease subunit B
MLRLIIGKAKSGKTEYIYDHIKEADDNNEKSFLIVPEQFTMESESELSRRLKSGVLLNVEVISFERLAFRLVDNMRGISAVKIDDHGKIMVLRRLFNHYKDEMQIFKRATNKEGFLSEFNNLIQELKRNRSIISMVSPYKKKRSWKK